jgi:streptogramin lyase
MIRTRFEVITAAASAVASLLLAGCTQGTISILSPADGGFATPTGGVAASVSIGGGTCGSSFQATLDGVVVTQQFSPQPPASATPQASFSVGPGDHLLKVSVQAGSSCNLASAQSHFYSVGSNVIYVGDGYTSTTHSDRIVRISDMTGVGWTTAGGPGSGTNQFSFPRGIYVYSIEKIYVADESNHRIAMFEGMTGAAWTTFGTQGYGPNQFADPIGITLDRHMRIYVTDGWAHRVVRIDDMTGTNWTALGAMGAGAQQFNAPAGVVVDGTDRIYVVDSVNGRIVRMDDMNGGNWTTFGTVGSGQNQFDVPGWIALDASGRIYVSDSNNCRIVRINDMTGAGWVSLGTPGSGTNQFNCTQAQMGGIFVDSAGRIYVVDAGNSRIVRMDDMTGSGWIAFGTHGTGVNQFLVPSTIFVKPPSLVVAPH